MSSIPAESRVVGDVEVSSLRLFAWDKQQSHVAAHLSLEAGDWLPLRAPLSSLYYLSHESMFSVDF